MYGQALRAPGGTRGGALLVAVSVLGFALGFAGYLLLDARLESNAAPRKAAAEQAREPARPPPSRPPVPDDVKALTSVPAGTSVAVENFYARLDWAERGIVLKDESAERYEYFGWKLGEVAPGKSLVVSATLQRGNVGQAVALTMRFTSASGQKDHECIAAPDKGEKSVRGAAAAEDVSLRVDRDEIVVSCRSTSPAVPSELQVFLVPAIGERVGRIDAAAIGSVVLRALAITER